MTLDVLQFVISALVVVAAGVWLTRSVDTISELTGLGRLLIGSVLLAAMTSLPELSVGLSAATQGLTDMAAGNMIGSSLYNLLILAGLDLAVRHKGRMLSRASAAHALSATMSMLLTALVGLAILTRGTFAVGPLGIGSLGVLLAWALGVRIIHYDQRSAREATEDGPRRPREHDASERRRLRRAGLSTLAAAAVMFVAAPFVPSAAERIAEQAGLTESFIGTALVALSTSLPELATSTAAVRLGAYDLALGNVFGSNAFNMVMMLPLDLATPEPLLANVSRVHAATCFWVVVVTAVAVVGQLYRIEKRVALIEPDALLMILLILGALVGSAAGG